MKPYAQSASECVLMMDRLKTVDGLGIDRFMKLSVSAKSPPPAVWYADDLRLAFPIPVDGFIVVRKHAGGVERRQVLVRNIFENSTRDKLRGGQRLKSGSGQAPISG